MATKVVARILLLFALLPSSANANENSVVKMDYLPLDFYGPNEPDKIFGMSETLSRQPASTSSWAPIGGTDYPLSEPCSPDYFKTMYSTQPSQQAQGNFVRAYFRSCGKQLSRNHPTGIDAMLSLNNVSYNVILANVAQPFRFTFKNGESVTGLILLKPDNLPRPMVVIRAGLYSDGGLSGSTSALLAHFYDESPFHVMTLSSQSAERNMIENHRVSIGGFVEGMENIEVGKWLKHQAPFRKKISSLHSFGISLGGNAGLFSSLYNDHNLNDFSSEKIYNSTIAICPVVDVKASMDKLFLDKVKGPIVGKMTWDLMKKAYPDVPDLQGLVSPDAQPKYGDWPRIISEASIRYFHRQNPLSYLFPFKGSQVANPDDLWKRDNFFHFNRVIDTPTLVWGSRNDIVVANDVNGGLLEKKLVSPAVQVVNADHGSHCGISIAYGWETVSTIFRTFILSHSPEFSPKPEQLTAVTDFPSPWPPWGAKHATQIWEAEPNKNYIKLHYKIWNPNLSVCLTRDIYMGRKECYYDDQVQIPRERIEFLGLPVPTTQLEAEMQSRRLNSHVKILGPDQKPLVNTTNMPAYLMW